MVKKAVLTGACLYTAGALAQGTCGDILVPRNPAPVVANGWQAQLVAGGLTKPRSIQFDEAGALLVVESGKGISRHRFTDNGGTCLHANHSHMLVELQGVCLESHISSLQNQTSDASNSSTMASPCPMKGTSSTPPPPNPYLPGPTTPAAVPSPRNLAPSSPT